MNKLKPTINELEQKPIDLDNRCKIMSDKKIKLLNALLVLTEIVRQEQTEIDSEKYDFFQEYDYFYYRVQRRLWSEIDDPLETHILINFVSTYIDHM